MADNAKILVVDDEPDVEPLVLMRMRREISSGQYQFLFAHNGVEALEVLKREGDVDIVMSDINMPQMDGLTLLERIAEAGLDLRSVIISAYGDMKNIRTAMNRGAFDFIVKPIDFDDFRATISRALQQLRQWREALVSRDKLVVIENELHVANNIQQSILPTDFPQGDGFQIHGGMEPARDVGGDFFYVEQLDNGHIALAIADVSGKGVPAALFMVLSRSLIKSVLRGDPAPGKVLGLTNALLQEDNDSAMFVTVFYAVYDPDSGKLVYANGGHNPPLHVRPDGAAELLQTTDGVALGVIADYAYAEQEIQLQPGDSVFCYTDGVTESVNSQDEEFGVDRTCQVFRATPGMDAQTANSATLEALKAFTGDAPPFDDITCLTLHRNL